MHDWKSRVSLNKLKVFTEFMADTASYRYPGPYGECHQRIRYDKFIVIFMSQPGYRKG